MNTKEMKGRQKLISEILKLNDHDFETVMYYLLGNEAEKEAALKILDDARKNCPDYCTYSWLI